MSIAEVLLLAVGLSMDAFAVSVCKGLAMQKATFSRCVLCGIWFGGFQALMPILGYLIGARFEKYIHSVAPWIAFSLLLLIGANMMRESFSKEEEPENAALDVKTMVLLAVATSIDALAVGVTFACVPLSITTMGAFANVLIAAAVIGVITFALSCIGVKVGSLFGAKYKSKAEFAGGLILIFIGAKILLEHFKIL